MSDTFTYIYSDLIFSHISYSFLLLHIQKPRCRCSYCSSSTWSLLYKHGYQPDKHFSPHCPIFRLKQCAEERSPFSWGTKTPVRAAETTNPEVMQWLTGWQADWLDWEILQSPPLLQQVDVWRSLLSLRSRWWWWNCWLSDRTRESESNENRGSMWPKGNPTLRDSSLSKNSKWNVFSLKPTRADLSNMLFIRKKNQKPTKVKQKQN